MPKEFYVRFWHIADVPVAAYMASMSSACCHADQVSEHRRVLWTVLTINLIMFLIEVGAGLAAGSASLQADALDFLGDAGNYAISLFVLGMALRYRATAALLKGATMGVFGLWVVGTVIWHAAHGYLAERLHYGRRRYRRADRQRCLVRSPVGLSLRRC